MRLGPLGLAALALAACPRKPPDPAPVAPEAQIAQRATLTSSFEDLDLSLYEAFVAGPAEGTPVGELARRHDADRYTATLQEWGPPYVPVLQMEDTDSPTRESGAVVGWKLVSGPEGLVEQRHLSPQDLYTSDAAALVVGSVLQRAWDGGVLAEDPFELLVSLSEQLPGPWSICRPRTEEEALAEDADDDAAALLTAQDPVLLYAIDGSRGARLGLRALPPVESAEAVSGEGPFRWTVDHLEQAPASRDVGQLWASMGFSDCVELGKVLDAERVRRPRRALGPQG